MIPCQRGTHPVQTLVNLCFFGLDVQADATMPAIPNVAIQRRLTNVLSCPDGNARASPAKRLASACAEADIRDFFKSQEQCRENFLNRGNRARERVSVRIPELASQA